MPANEKIWQQGKKHIAGSEKGNGEKVVWDGTKKLEKNSRGQQSKGKVWMVYRQSYDVTKVEGCDDGGRCYPMATLVYCNKKRAHQF